MFFDDDDLDLYKDDEDDRENNDYGSSEKYNSKSNMVGSVVGVAKEFIDDSTREIVNEKIREVVDDMASSVDAPKLGKSLLLGSVAGVIITIALYKIFK